MPCSQAEEEGEAMGVHCSRPHDGSDPGGVGCLRLSGLQMRVKCKFGRKPRFSFIQSGDRK